MSKHCIYRPKDSTKENRNVPADVQTLCSVLPSQTAHVSCYPLTLITTHSSSFCNYPPASILCSPLFVYLWSRVMKAHEDMLGEIQSSTGLNSKSQTLSWEDKLKMKIPFLNEDECFRYISFMYSHYFQGFQLNAWLTDVKTSVVCWMVAILVHFHFWKSCTRVGLCSVADGWVRKKVGKRWRLDRAGELEPYDSWGTGGDKNNPVLQNDD